MAKGMRAPTVFPRPAKLRQRGPTTRAPGLGVDSLSTQFLVGKRAVLFERDAVTTATPEAGFGVVSMCACVYVCVFIEVRRRRLPIPRDGL